MVRLYIKVNGRTERRVTGKKIKGQGPHLGQLDLCFLFSLVKSIADVNHRHTQTYILVLWYDCVLCFQLTLGGQSYLFVKPMADGGMFRNLFKNSYFGNST